MNDWIDLDSEWFELTPEEEALLKKTFATAPSLPPSYYQARVIIKRRLRRLGVAAFQNDAPLVELRKVLQATVSELVSKGAQLEVLQNKVLLFWQEKETELPVVVVKLT